MTPLAALLEGLPLAALALDGGGRVAAANGLARALLGGAPIDGKLLTEIVHFGPDAAQALNEMVGQGAAAPAAREREGDALGGEEGGRGVVVSLGALDPALGAGYVAVLRDVADERRRERLRVTHEKLTAISQLAAGVAHEFNNIMASLLGFAQLARQDPAFIDELISAVEEYADRSREITRRLRSFSPEHLGPLEAVSFTDLADKVLARFDRELTSADIKVERRYQAVPETLVNRRELEEVLESLVQNARHAVVKSGAISIEVRPDGDRFILIRIADTGYGIPKDNLTRVFEPFFTLKQTSDLIRPGAGLGLAVAYNYVKRHQGEIWAESEPGKGTRFTIRLPVRAERRRTVPVEAGPVAVGTPPPPDGLPAVDRRTGGAPPSRSVLAIDDEESITKLLESILADHRIVTARSAREAMAALNRKGPFDYVVLDLLLPGELDGFELFEEISKRDRAAKIILLTGLVEDERVKDYAARAYGYLRKPFGIKDLSTLIV